MSPFSEGGGRGERTRWTVRAERVVDQDAHLRLSVATVELPDGTRFDQYVARRSRCVMTVVLDEGAERMLLIARTSCTWPGERTGSAPRTRTRQKPSPGSRSASYPG